MTMRHTLSMTYTIQSLKLTKNNAMILTSFSKVEECRKEHGAGDKEKEQGTQGIHTPLDSNNHDFDSHNDRRRVLECPENAQESKQSQDRKSKVHRLSCKNSTMESGGTRTIDKHDCFFFTN